jgi:hypothetical protein
VIRHILERSIDELPDELRIVFGACVVKGTGFSHASEVATKPAYPFSRKPIARTVWLGEETVQDFELLGERLYLSEGVPIMGFISCR